MELWERVDNYNRIFYQFPKMWFDKGWMLGIWNCGNNYKGSGYYGAYPPKYLERINALFPDKKKILHLFSGSLPPGDYVRFDRLNSDVIGEAERLSTYFEPASFDIIYADPPYSQSDAEHYGTCLVNRNKVVKECHKILKPDGFLCWMDQVLPMYSKDDFRRVGEIGISRSTNHRVRFVFIFRMTHWSELL